MAEKENYFEFILPSKVEYGPGTIKTLPEELLRNDFKRVVFVVTPGRNRSGMLDGILAVLAEEGSEATVFDRVIENPDLASVADCVQFLRAFTPDAVVGVGGGSALDTAKAAAVCYSNGTDSVLDLLNGDGGSRKIKKKSLPAIMVPTTAGSGTEVNYWAVITNKAEKEKLSVGAPAMSPHMAIVDPELTLSLPPKVTLYTGIDALTHAIESYLSKTSNWLSDMFSFGAITLIMGSLRRAVDDGANLVARCNMALASMLAGVAMENVGLGLIHAMSHQVSGFYDTPHGLANALLLPEVLAFNRPGAKEKIKSLDRMARGKGGFIRWIEKLYREYDLWIKGVEIKGEDIRIMAVKAADNVNVRTNPVVAGVADIEKIYQECFKIV